MAWTSRFQVTLENTTLIDATVALLMNGTAFLATGPNVVVPAGQVVSIDDIAYLWQDNVIPPDPADLTFSFTGTPAGAVIRVRGPFRIHNTDESAALEPGPFAPPLRLAAEMTSLGTTGGRDASGWQWDQETAGYKPLPLAVGDGTDQWHGATYSFRPPVREILRHGGGGITVTPRNVLRAEVSAGSLRTTSGVVASTVTFKWAQVGPLDTNDLGSNQIRVDGFLSRIELTLATPSATAATVVTFYRTSWLTSLTAPEDVIAVLTLAPGQNSLDYAFDALTWNRYQQLRWTIDPGLGAAGLGIEARWETG